MRYLITVILFITTFFIILSGGEALAADGDVVFTRTHNGPDNISDVGLGITVDSSGFIYVCGYESVTGQSGNIWVRKYNPDGSTNWTKTYNGPDNGNDQVEEVVVDTSGNVYVAGFENIAGEGWNIWVRKYSSSGNEVWTRTHNGPDNNNDAGYSIAVDTSGNVYVTGYETVTGEGENIWIRKYNSDGSTNWTRTHNGSADSVDRGYGIAVDTSGNVYVTGFENANNGGYNIWVRKYNFDGSTNWTIAHNGPANSTDFGNGIVVDVIGNVYVTGAEDVSGEGRHIWVRKYNSDSSTNWTRIYNGSANGNDYGYGIAVDTSRNVYVTGYEAVAGEMDNIWVRKYNADGSTNWTRTHSGPANGHDRSFSVAVDSSGNSYVAGSETVTGEGFNIWIRKYSGPPPPQPVWIPQPINSSTQIDLKWNNVPLETSYTLFRNSVYNTNTATNYIGFPADTTNYSDIGLLPSTTYYYWLKVYSAIGASSFSAVSSNRTLPVPPGTPQFISVTNFSTNQVDLLWNNVTNESGYILYYSVVNNPGFSSILTTLPANTTNYSHMTNKTFYYWLKATNIGWFSGYSAVGSPIPLPDTTGNFTIKILPNYVGKNDIKQAKIYLGKHASEGVYRVRILNMQGTRVVKDFENVPYTELKNGLLWNLEEGDLSSGIYIVFVTRDGKSYQKNFFYRK
jgi:uncharacterized delta-60 repeat protein